MLSLISGMLSSALLAASASSTSVPPAHDACRATLTVTDARTLATETPNARAFVENLKATLKTEIAGRNGNSVKVRVINTANKNEVIGVYSVNLRTGAVLDDDQEPAEDGQTAATRQRLIARHCNSR
ncbi:MAG: hypothetical protein JSS87_05570 [Acidobacteria bacterium]|nr:hypothetical protein [Acidobacteriota bacterium]